MEFPDKDETDSEMATQEFNFQPEKRVQQDLPTDLFSKVLLMVWTYMIFLNTHSIYMITYIVS